MLRAGVTRTANRRPLRPDCAAALKRTARLDIPNLARAVHGLGALSRDFRESELPRIPAVVVTADRKEDHSVRRAHTRLATALGAPVVCRPGATHSVHLDRPDETLAAVRDVVAQVGAAT
ncbi:hypothetical protein GTY65_00575 [Streptomyces sp. SID8379]|uniref:alpha/beta fold hydrolase n=1 Tax=unclassified Streptomyces TaxID=2593676 RepID=UPI00037D4535|nr:MULTISPECIES: hypothetical protein [unclassified Streptomyces]MYW62581.1 hypothetical protein [Streptomyces sp. SID8379]